MDVFYSIAWECKGADVHLIVLDVNYEFMTQSASGYDA